MARTAHPTASKSQSGASKIKDFYFGMSVIRKAHHAGPRPSPPIPDRERGRR